MSTFLVSIKDFAPWVAIAFSCLALYVSILNYRRDRANVQVTSAYSESWLDYEAGIHINIVNTGRRPIVLDTLVYVEYGHNKLGMRTIANSLGRVLEQNNGLTLTERQKHRLWLSAPELGLDCEGEIIEADDMWITDTLNQRYKIRGIRKNIIQLRAWAAKQQTSRVTA